MTTRYGSNMTTRMTGSFSPVTDAGTSLSPCWKITGLPGLAHRYPRPISRPV